MSEQQPPEAELAERAVLGSMLLEWEACEWAADNLRPQDWYSPAYRELFAEMVKVHKAGEPVDLVTLPERIKASSPDLFAQLGGLTFFIALQRDAPTAASIARYGGIVRERSYHRAALRLCAYHFKQLHEVGGAPMADILAGIERDWRKLAEGAPLAHAERRLGEVLDETLGEIEEQELRGYEAQPTLSTGLAQLDNVLGGLYPGYLLVIGARPGDGKTVIAGNILAGLAIASKVPTAIFSLEMRAQALAVRIISWQARTNHRNLRLAKVGPDGMAAVINAVGRIHDAPLWIDDTPGLSAQELSARARRMIRQYNLRAIGVDFAQLVRASDAKDRRLEVEAVMREMCELARATDVPVILLSQLSREVESRENRKPIMRDFAESSSLEVYADQALAIWHPPNRPEDGVKYLCVLKNRSGEKGIDVPVWWEPQYQAFRDASKAEAEAEAAAMREKPKKKQARGDSED